MGLARQLWLPGAGAVPPVVWAERSGRVAAGAPPWRLAYVGRAALAADFDFLSPQGPPWEVRAAGSGRQWASLVRRAEGALAGAGLPCLQVVERWWGLPGAGRAAPPTVYATHLLARCPVAASQEAQFAQLRSPELRARWQRAAGLSHRLSRAADDLRAFYARMVAGQDRRRFGDTGAVLPLSAFAERLAAGGVLVQVWDAGGWVSGVLMGPAADGQGLAVFRPGVAGADGLSDAALARLTCYHDIAVLQVAREAGQRWLDLGLTRALAHNPIYLHKKALGSSFEVAPRCPTFGLAASGSAERLLDEHAPLVLL